jgi:hypothetical protein
MYQSAFTAISTMNNIVVVFPSYEVWMLIAGDIIVSWATKDEIPVHTAADRVGVLVPIQIVTVGLTVDRVSLVISTQGVSASRSADIVTPAEPSIIIRVRCTRERIIPVVPGPGIIWADVAYRPHRCQGEQRSDGKRHCDPRGSHCPSLSASCRYA